MGCDIHIYREKQINGEWVSADKWTPYDYGDDDKGVTVEWDDRAFTGRNYNLFGLLSDDVRTSHPFSFAPRGMPVNASPEVSALSEGWGVDGHGHSYLYLHELRDMQKYIQTATVQIEGMKNRDELKKLRDSIASDSPDWRLLYPYCKWSSDTVNNETFTLDVPASFIVGDGLEKIISSFDGIDGDNHRIVFFFDN